MSDDQLLAVYAEAGDERAFRRVVDRHAGMVFATALKWTGNAELAKEASQLVFTALARKARRLAGHPSLSRWLFRATILESKKLLRTESRRRRKHAALECASAGAHLEPSPAPAVTGREPGFELLDDAIDSLPGRHQDVIRLRFFEGMSYAEIAADTGCSEAAVRMQVHRALKRLSSFMERRNAPGAAGAVTAAAVATHLAAPAPASASFSTVSPATLASNAVLSGAPSHPLVDIATTTITTMSKYKLAGISAIAAAIVTGVPGVLAWRQAASLRSELAGVTARGAATTAAAGELGATGATAGGRPGAAGDGRLDGATPSVNPAGPAERTADRWRAALFEADPVRRHRQIAALLENLTAEVAPVVAEAFAAAREDGGTFDQEFSLFVRAWAEIDGPAAVSHAVETAGDGDVATPATLAAIGGWATRDPAAAQAWVEQAEDGDAREKLVFGLLDGWSIVDFEAASAYAESRPRSSERDEFVELLFKRSLMAGGVPAAQRWFEGIADDKHNELYKRNAFDKVIREMLYRDPSSAAHWIANHSGAPYLDISGALPAAAGELAATDPHGAIAWLDSLDGLSARAADRSADALIGRWLHEDLAGAETWLASHPDHPHYGAMAGAAALGAARADDSTDGLAAAADWVASIDDPGWRHRTELTIAREQLGRHGNGPETVAKLLDAGLSPDTVEEAHQNPAGGMTAFAFARTEHGEMEIMADSISVTLDEGVEHLQFYGIEEHPPVPGAGSAGVEVILNDLPPGATLSTEGQTTTRLVKPRPGER